MADEELEITQVRSANGRVDGQRRTLRSLGLRRIRQTVRKPDRPEIRGMLAKVAHLVEVRYPGVDAIVGIEPGQEPKGAGQPPAGSSVPDDEVAELREAEEEALSVAGSATLGSLVDNPQALGSVEDPDRPKPAKGLTEDEPEEGDAEAAAEGVETPETAEDES